MLRPSNLNPRIFQLGILVTVAAALALFAPINSANRAAAASAARRPNRSARADSSGRRASHRPVRSCMELFRR